MVIYISLQQMHFYATYIRRSLQNVRFLESLLIYHWNGLEQTRFKKKKKKRRKSFHRLFLQDYKKENDNIVTKKHTHMHALIHTETITCDRTSAMSVGLLQTQTLSIFGLNCWNLKVEYHYTCTICTPLTINIV